MKKHIRDREIDRLVSFAKGLGSKVVFRTASDVGAEWDTKTSTITVRKNKYVSKTEIIIWLLHEIGHMLHYRATNNIVPQEVNEALTLHDNEEDPNPDSRHLVYETEIDAMPYWDSIVQDCNIKIPKWKIDLEKEFQQFHYRVWWREGRMTTGKERKAKFKELKSKYKGGK